jgi:putative membrane protein
LPKPGSPATLLQRLLKMRWSRKTRPLSERLRPAAWPVELSKIAQKSENADVKRFADRMVEDHTKANEQLTSIATELGVQMPKTLDSEHERMREKLQTLHGKAFDDQYSHDMVEDHNKAIKLFQQEERSGHNTELKQFAQKTLPTLEEHQKMALELSHELAQTAAR